MACRVEAAGRYVQLRMLLGCCHHVNTPIITEVPRELSNVSSGTAYAPVGRWCDGVTREMGRREP